MDRWLVGSAANNRVAAVQNLLPFIPPNGHPVEGIYSAVQKHQDVLGPLCRKILIKEENVEAAAEEEEAPPPEYIQKRKVFVGCVGQEGAEEIDLPHFFSNYGEIEQGPIWVYNNTNTNTKVCSFIYKTIDGADKAAKEPHKNYQGRALCCQRTIDRPTLIKLVPSILDKWSPYLPQSPEDWCRNLSLCDSVTVYLSIICGSLMTQIAHTLKSNHAVQSSVMRGFSNGALSSSSSSSSMQESSSGLEIVPTGGGGGGGPVSWPHGSIGGMTNHINHLVIYYDQACHEVGHHYPGRDIRNWMRVCEYLRGEQIDGTDPARLMTSEDFIAVVTQRNIVTGTQKQIDHFISQCHMMTFKGVYQRVRRGTTHTGQKYYWWEPFTHQAILFPPILPPVQGVQPVHPDLRTRENLGEDPMVEQFLQQHFP